MSRTWEIIGAPYDLSANETGAAAAPAFVRQRYTARWAPRFRQAWNITLLDGGDVEVAQAPEVGPNASDALASFCQALSQRVVQSYELGHTPVIIGGDHSISVGSVSGAALHLQHTRPGARLGLLWVDAHADLNTNDLGNLHGKAAALLLGFGPELLTGLGGLTPKVQPRHLIELGIQEVMPSEYRMIREHGIQVYPMHVIDRLGVRQACTEAIARLEQDTDAFFVSLDIDACGAEAFDACTAPMVGGLSARELCAVVELAAGSSKFCGLDLVEFCPAKDATGNTGRLIEKVLHTLFGYTQYNSGGESTS